MSDRRDGEMPGSLPPALVTILDMIVLERLQGGAFRQLGSERTPAWFSEAFWNAAPGAPVTLLQAFPVLDSFLTEAEAFWSRTSHGRLDGEAFVVSGPDGQNLPLAAIAVAYEGRPLLLIQRVPGFDDRQHVLQRAREQALVHEGVVKGIDALRRPFGRLAGLATELAATAGLSESQKALVSGLTSELEAMRQLLEQLPKLPPATSARRK
jgi:hypothetical protein